MHRARLVIEQARRAEELSRKRKRADECKARMGAYYNRRWSGLDPTDFGHQGAYNPGITINTMLSVGESLCARVCADQPKPDFLVVGGSWLERYAGRRLNKFILGEYHRLKSYQLAEQCQSDIMWSDLSVLKVYHDGKRVTHERIAPWNIIVDERGALTTPPRTLYQRAHVPAEVLQAEYPDAKIGDKRGLLARLRGNTIETDMIEVIEAWHLPSAEGADDGLHVIAIEGEELHSEPWTHDVFPFAFMRWTELPLGFYGQSLVEQQASMQDAFNDLMEKFSESFGLTSMRVVAEEGAFAKKTLTNKPGEILWVRPGFMGKIQFVTPGSVAADAYGHAWRIQEQQYRTSGVSEMTAAGQRPTAELSGIALRTLEDMETLRHVLNVRRYQNFILTIADLTVRFAKECYKHNKDYKAQFVGKRFVETIPWKDVSIDHYVIQLWPSNILPSTPTGKLATVQDLLAAGLIGARAGLALLDFPDIDAHVPLESVELEYVDYLVEQILLKDALEQFRPAIYQSDLGLAVRRVGQSIMRFRMDGATEADLEPLLTWIELAQDEVVKRQARMKLVAMREQMAAQQGVTGNVGATGGSPGPGNGSPAGGGLELGGAGLGGPGAVTPGPELGGAPTG